MEREKEGYEVADVCWRAGPDTSTSQFPRAPMSLVLPHAQLSSLDIFPLLRTRCSPKCTIQPLILAHISLLRMCVRDLSQCGPVLPKGPAAALTEGNIDIFTACLERGREVSAIVY